MNGLELTTIEGGALDGYDPQMARLGQAANAAAAAGVLVEYRAGKAASTLANHDRALALFANYLSDHGAPRTRDALAVDVGAWAGVSWGLLKGFRQTLVNGGYSVSSVNGYTSHVRNYARLALAAVDSDESAKMALVKGYGHNEGVNLDENRAAANVPTRIGTKKETNVKLTADQVDALLDQPTDTPQGRRDRLLVHLLAVHGLRVSEVARLQVSDATLARDAGGVVVAGVLEFYRPKTKTEGRHNLKNGTLAAMVAYLETDAPAVGPLIRASRKDGTLNGAGVSTRRLSERVRTLGESIGVAGLTAHDLRHHAATVQAPKGVRHLMDAFGWTSASTAMRYVAAADAVDVE